MKITEAVTRAIETNHESDWQLIYYLNNTYAHSDFLCDKHETLFPEWADSNMMVTCNDVGAREGMEIHGVN